FIEKIPYFFLSLLFGLIALFGGYLIKAFYIESSYALLTKLMGASGDIIFYLNKLFLPVKLSVLYPYTEIKNNPFFLYSFVVVIILLAGIIVSRRYSKKVIFGSGLFLLTIFPALRCLPLKEIIVADRYAYLPAIGIFYLFAEGCMWLYKRKIKYYCFIRIFLVIVLAVVVIFLGCSTWKRSQIWKDSLSLWNDVLEKYPDTATAYNNRGEFFLGKGEYNKALSDFILAISARTKYPYNPAYKYYHLNLGNSLRALGRDSEAIAVFEQLIKETEAYFSLANIKDLLGDKNKAIALYTRAIELDPRLLYAHDYLGALYANLNRKEEAKAELHKAIELDPTYIPAYVKLAGIYKTLNQEEKLELLYKKAIANNLDFFDAYYYIGNLFADAQKDKDAILLYSKAIEINPGSKEACVGLGSSYLTIGRNKEAIIWLKKALELDSNLAVAHNNLALAYYYAGEYGLAIEHCDKARGLGYTISPKLLELINPHRK
ncbi:MAG: tetratricopeptide repeat protein, partial [Chloroflexota bacterium]|nr:tetratricopeptide repeat protein [Chloroflexota bacterium]